MVLIFSHNVVRKSNGTCQMSTSLLVVGGCERVVCGATRPQLGNQATTHPYTMARDRPLLTLKTCGQQWTAPWLQRCHRATATLYVPDKIRIARHSIYPGQKLPAYLSLECQRPRCCKGSSYPARTGAGPHHALHS